MKHGLKTIIALISLVVLAGCAKEKKKATASEPPPPVVAVPSGPYVPPGSGPGQGPGQNWEYGATAELKVVSTSRMSDYTGRPMNNPTNIKVNVNLEKYGSGYGGHVSISYDDNGYHEEGYFTSGSSEQEVKYNIWFHKSGEYAYHGFFEDFLGGVILVIDEWIDLGDGAGPEDKIGGSIWFKNFGLTYAPHPPTRCWFVSLGPYDCRSWKTDRGVETTRAIDPDSGYQKLGTFTGMSLKDAFNGQTEEILANF